MLKNILSEIAVLIVLIVILLIVDNSEIIELFSCGDAGRIIGSFGILWLLAAFVRISTGWDEWAFSLLCAFGCFIFGFELHSDGLFYAIFAIGIYYCILACICAQFSKSLALILLISGLLLSIIGYPFRSLTTPTKIHAVDYVESSH